MRTVACTLRPTTLAFLLVAVGAACAEETKPQCAEADAKGDYARKAELPPGAAEAVGFAMAEAGEPFQATDVIMKKGLPRRRFVSARRTGCHLRVEVERGGIALRHETVDLDLVADKWVVHKH